MLVAGRNFGCGSSREHAPWALLDFGFRAVVSSEIADIFRSNALKNGLLPVVVDEADASLAARASGRRSHDRRREQHARRCPTADACPFELDAFARHCLLNGVDELGFLLAARRAIAAYESTSSAKPHEGHDRRICRATASARKSPRPRVACCARSRSSFGHEFAFDEQPIGGAAIDATAIRCPPPTLAACKRADAVLLGAVGGPKWSDPKAKVRPEQGLLACARRSACTRTCARCSVHPRARGALAAQDRAARRRRPAVRARAHRRHLLRREDPRRRHGATDECAIHRRRRSSASTRRAFALARSAPQAGHLGRQGQRARDLAAVARRRDTRVAAEFPDVDARAPAGRFDGDAAADAAGARST